MEALPARALFRPCDSCRGALPADSGGQRAMAQLTYPISKAGLAVPVWIGLSGDATDALLAAGEIFANPWEVPVGSTPIESRARFGINRCRDPVPAPPHASPPAAVAGPRLARAPCCGSPGMRWTRPHS